MLVPGGCAHCDGRGYTLSANPVGDGTKKLYEGKCGQCCGTGRVGEWERRRAEEKRQEHEEAVRRNKWAQEQGYRDSSHYYYSEQDRRQKESAAQYPPQCSKCGGNGRVSVTWAMVNPNSDTFVDRPCPRCGGSGIGR